VVKTFTLACLRLLTLSFFPGLLDNHFFVYRSNVLSIKKIQQSFRWNCETCLEKWINCVNGATTRWSHLSLICKLLHWSPSVVAKGLLLSNKSYNGIRKIKRFSYLNRQFDKEPICSLFKFCDLMMKTKPIVVLVTPLVIIPLVSESNCWHGSLGKGSLKKRFENFIISSKSLLFCFILRLANYLALRHCYWSWWNGVPWKREFKKTSAHDSLPSILSREILRKAKEVQLNVIICKFLCKTPV